MENSEIRNANKRALPKFILIVIISLIVGLLTGFYSAKYGLNMLEGSIKSAGVFFGAHIAPWLMLTTAIIGPAVCVPIYRSAGKLRSSWDGENDDISDAIDRKLSVAIWISDAALILSFFLMAASYSNGFETFENRNSTAAFIVSIVSFFTIMIEALIIQQKCVDAYKKANPEKTASIYDLKFQKKWMDSCDEAEKLLAGKCAVKAFVVTNTVCTVLSSVLAVCALTFGIGFLPSFTVCLIWIVNLSVYNREMLKYSKAGSKLSW